jgi:hypothetical protein
MFGRGKRFAQERELLAKLANGATLKAHRELDGGKQHRLHQLDGRVDLVSARTVGRLRRRGLIASNKKFPAATYLLTDKGRNEVQALRKQGATPLSTRRYQASPFE